MAQDNLERYRQISTAFAGRDLEGFLALLAPDVDFEPRSAALEGGPLHGHDAVRVWWDTMFRLFAEYHVEIAEVVDLGDDRIFGRATVRGEAMGSGAGMEEPQWHLVEWRDGSVIHWRTFRDEAEARAAAGLLVN
jgi:ketosteroid isomerase-like protein